MRSLLVAALLASTSQFALADTAQTPDFSQYAQYTADSGIRIDYSIFSHILDSVIYDVGPSDRWGARGQLIETATRINRQSTSEYRYEGNRVWFHLLTDEHKATITEYRRELEQLPSQVDLSDLTRDEQLAYWLNLHNVVMLDEIAQAYPVRYINNIHIDGERLMDAPIVNLPSGPISLRQLQTDIVLANWQDPLVMYGFYTGAIGGPSLQETAFSGANVWRILGRTADEFVNALRGVDGDGRSVDVSKLYHDYAVLFPNWPEDLRSHLLRYASSGEVEYAVRNAERFTRLPFDRSIADITHGTLCGGSGFNPINTVNVQTGEQSFSGACEELPVQAQQLIIEVRERRIRLFESGRLGRVTVRDIPTEDGQRESGSTIQQSGSQPVLILRRSQAEPEGDGDSED